MVCLFIVNLKSHQICVLFCQINGDIQYGIERHHLVQSAARLVAARTQFSPSANEVLALREPHMLALRRVTNVGFSFVSAELKQEG